jgi:transglutaminase-like putative cysteine protease/tetratricopeptide (TPR) repeat protein
LQAICLALSALLAYKVLRILDHEVSIVLLPSYPLRLLGLTLLLFATQMSAAEVWDSPAFTVDVPTLRKAASTVKAEKHSEATLLLNDLHFEFDESGKMVQTRHVIYRIENQQGVDNWAETSGLWEPWHQDRPLIKARVITSEEAEHWLDLKTLNDVPVHQNAPDVYSDERRYGGPLPAIAPGAIIEEEIVIRDTAPLFASGTTHRWVFAWAVPVNKTHLVITHPESAPLHYQVHMLPEATVTKSLKSGVETITLDQGPLPAYTEQIDHVPSDVVLYPEIEFSNGTSWQQVATEYAHLSDEKLHSTEVEAFIAKIDVKGLKEEDIVRRLVSTLHKYVRYTGVEFGQSSFIPQFPSETLKRKYGDCKDKATLLVAMLRSAGIAANLALLDAGPGRDINTDLPGLGMFDHAIVYVPASASHPELWIDATAQYSQVGTLPWMDYGRWALIVGDKDDPLKKIPAITATENIHRELRDFTFAEYGMANIVETDEETGPEEADYRGYYSGDSKTVNEASETYVKAVYLAESIPTLEHGDLSDLDKPATIKFITKGKRGNTDLNTALAAIRVEALFDSLPKYFRTKEEEQSPDTDESEKRHPRTVDWWVTPFTIEWRYRITAPLGFKLRALPSEKSEQFIGLSFTQKYSSNSEGTVVEAALQVQNTNTRMTVEQGKEFRDAVLKARSADPILISFDNVGHSLISAGKIKEGLVAYGQVAAQHPREALHKVQLADALLTAGLGEEARSEALEATRLEPDSALAFSILGMVLKHDLIGRLLKKGMDYDGAVLAYHKAIKLDPKDKETRANLALLLEYDAEGTRYSEKAGLKEAVDVLRDLKKLDEDYGRTYDDNIIYDLWYAHDYKGVLDCLAPLPSTDVRKGMLLAATALQLGKDAALKKALEITSDDQERSRALATAGAVLVRVRRYQEGAALMKEGARGQSNESQIMRSADLFSRSKPYTDIDFEETDPRSVIQKLFSGMLTGEMTITQLLSLIYVDPNDSYEAPDQKQFEHMMSMLRSEIGATGLPLTVAADLAISNMHYTMDGDDAVGYKITIESPGADTQDMYVIKDGTHYKVAAFSANGSDVEELAPLALRAIEKNDLVAARKWLDRARDKIHVNGGDDPLAGSPFPYFWTKGQDADVTTMRTAALVLLPSKALKGSYLTMLDHARLSAKTEIDRNRLTMVMTYAYSAQEQWADMLPLTEELMKSLPSSVRAFDLATTAYAGLKRFDEWNNLVRSRMLKYSDELEYVRSSANLAAYRGEFGKSRAIIKTIIDKGQANPSDLNSFAWYALFLPGPIEQEAIDEGQRANELTKSSNFSILHTLACVSAQAGKTSEARDLLLKAMDALHLEEPNSVVWLGFALIAERYGVVDAAERMYGRVEKPKIEYPDGSYTLAQRRLTSLRNVARTAVTAKR